MLTRLADFLHTHGRRVLIIAVIGAAVCGVFGVGVAKDLSPYGANDPATQSVKAAHRFEAAAGRKIDPGIVAIVSAGDVRTDAVERRVEHVAGQLRAEPGVASAVSFYETHDPAMASRDRRSTYVVAYFKPRSDKQLEDAAKRIEIVRAIREREERDLAHLRSIEPHASKGPAGSYLTLQMGIGLTEWTIKWCEATERQLAAESEEE